MEFFEEFELEDLLGFEIEEEKVKEYKTLISKSKIEEANVIEEEKQRIFTHHPSFTRLISCPYHLFENNQILCYYCGKNLTKDKKTEIFEHMKEDTKEFVIVIPVFQFKTPENVNKNAFLKDSFSVGLSKQMYKKLKERFRSRIKIFLATIKNTDPLFYRIPKNIKSPNNNKVVIYEYDQITENIIDEVLGSVKYRFVNINFLLNP